jgi:hypothetical protein
MSTSGWEINMLFRISLASLDGPLEWEFWSGERVGVAVDGFPRASRVPFVPYWSWDGGFARLLRAL